MNAHEFRKLGLPNNLDDALKMLADLFGSELGDIEKLTEDEFNGSVHHGTGTLFIRIKRIWSFQKLYLYLCYNWFH